MRSERSWPNAQVGIYAVRVAGVKTTGVCDFSNLNWLVLVCHCLLPLIAVPLTFILIPDALMTDTILDPSLLEDIPASNHEAIGAAKHCLAIDCLLVENIADCTLVCDSFTPICFSVGEVDEHDGGVMVYSAGDESDMDVPVDGMRVHSPKFSIHEE